MSYNIDPDALPLEEPLAELERLLIDEFLRSAGHNPDALRARHDDESRRLLVEASAYATSKMAEIETRGHYLRALRGKE
jgi:hypothetical protein